MMNKKGLTVGRVVLIILFLSIIGILIYSIILGVRNMPKPTKTTTDSSLRLIEPTDYNPIDDIYSYYIYGFKNSNFANSSPYSTDIYNYESNSLIYYFAVGSNGLNFMYNINDGFYPSSYAISKNNNNLLIGNDLLLVHDATRYISFNNWNSVRSYAIGYNCSIDIQNFNFTMYYNFPINSTFSLYFYVYTDAGSMKFTDFTFSSSTLIHNFAGSSILSTLPGASKVLRFGFAVAQSSVATNVSYYLPNSAGTSSVTNGINYDSNLVYSNYFNSLTQQQKDNSVYLSFATSSYPIDYIDGYNAGFNDSNNISNSTINSLNSSILSLQAEINNLTSTISAQQVTINSLQEQLNNSNTNFKGLFFTIADVPFKTVSDMLGFEVFGVNLFQFFVGIITALGLLWLIKKFI